MTGTNPGPIDRLDQSDWSRLLGALIENIDADDLPARLVDALTRLIPFELAAIFVYRSRSRPLNIYDNFTSGNAKKGIAAYVENSYVLNPFYQACQRGIGDGVYRIRDLAPDAYFESEYYRTHLISPRDSEEIGYITEFWPEGLEEVDIAVTLEPGVFAEFSIYRKLSVHGFTDDDLARLHTELPIISALLRRYWLVHCATAPQMPPPDSRVDDAFNNFGQSVLTAREREVAQLILRGHSSKSICINLGISLGTVKTHRKNVYAKLNISSQSELFATFLRALY